jgi:hypothetical protein
MWRLKIAGFGSKRPLVAYLLEWLSKKYFDCQRCRQGDRLIGTGHLRAKGAAILHPVAKNLPPACTSSFCVIPQHYFAIHYNRHIFFKNLKKKIKHPVLGQWKSALKKQQRYEKHLKKLP